jgi:protein SCO1
LNPPFTASILKTHGFKNPVLVAIVLVSTLLACQSAPKNDSLTQALPYYHTADFTPIWTENQAQLDTLHRLANFAFRNQNAQPITQDTFRGKVHVANFFFTVCPSLCPKIMANMKKVQDAFKDRSDVLIASYSVTPDRDSVPVLRAYATMRGILDNRWHLLTGDKKAIYTTARKSYFADENVGVQKGENDFLHTENFILVDKNLHIRGVYNGTLELEIEQLIEDIQQLNKE